MAGYKAVSKERKNSRAQPSIPAGIMGGFNVLLAF